MKVSVEKMENETFKPISLTIEFDNQAQLSIFYALFNYTPICEFLGKQGFDYQAVRESIETLNDAHNNEFHMELYRGLK